MPGSRDSLCSRFVAKTVKRNNGCLIWTGCKGRYGQIQEGGRKGSRLMAHRVSWELFRGPIPEGMSVLHNCPDGDDPHCVNPYHLFLGTQADNLDDMDRKGRRRNGDHGGAKNQAAKLTEAQVVDARTRASLGETHRSIAKSLGVSRAAMSKAIRGRTWSNVSH